MQQNLNSIAGVTSTVDGRNPEQERFEREISRNNGEYHAFLNKGNYDDDDDGGDHTAAFYRSVIE